MTLPPIHNTRSPRQWEIISKHIDFKDKTVIDLGCGYGDLLKMCWQAGAEDCQGIDNGLSLRAEKKLKDFSRNTELGNWFFFNDSDIEWIISTWYNVSFNVSILFSVLPYLSNPIATLEWMRDHSEIALIEIQQRGDGPGTLEGKEAIRDYLMGVFPSIECIGSTIAKKDRDYERFLWLGRT